MACVHVNKLYGDSNERCRCAHNAYVEILAQALSYCTSVRTQSGTILLHCSHRYTLDLIRIEHLLWTNSQDQRS